MQLFSKQLCLHAGLVITGSYTSVSKSRERSVKNYDTSFELYKKLSNNGEDKFCTLGDITKTEPLSKEVREYISKELPKYIKAMALVSDTPLGNTIGNIFTKVNLQSYPTNLFDNIEEAENWLKKFM
jgi:hypothetical protein